MVRIKDLSKEENNIIEEWSKHNVLVMKNFTYEQDNIFYEVNTNSLGESSNGCSYSFRSNVGKFITINIMTIIKNPTYFEKYGKNNLIP